MGRTPRRKVGKLKPKQDHMNNNQRRYDTEIEAVMFVPFTPGSKLTKDLQEIEDKWAGLLNNPKWNMVERSGSKLKDLLGNTTPWTSTNCGRMDCWMCKSNPEMRPRDCWTENATYRISCQECKESGSSAEYYGEAARTIYLHTKEHKSQLLKKVDDSPLYEQCRERHIGEIQEFKVDLISRHETVFSRQIMEGVLISNNPSAHKMNRRNEYNGSLIPTILVQTNGNILGTKRTHTSEKMGPNKRSRTKGPTDITSHNSPTGPSEPGRGGGPPKTVTNNSDTTTNKTSSTRVQHQVQGQ